MMRGGKSEGKLTKQEREKERERDDVLKKREREGKINTYERVRER